jgi:hypothetical protein
VENTLHELGIRTVVIPRKGRPGKVRQAHEHRRAFRRTVKWRTGSEARISALKRQYGWDRTHLDGLDGARIWTGTSSTSPSTRSVTGSTTTPSARTRPCPGTGPTTSMWAWPTPECPTFPSPKSCQLLDAGQSRTASAAAAGVLVAHVGVAAIPGRSVVRGGGGVRGGPGPGTRCIARVSTRPRATQTTDRRYLAEATMALLTTQAPQEGVATPEPMTA